MGFISDNFGRRTIIITISALHILASFSTSFSNSFMMFVMFRFFVGGSIHAVWASFFVLMAEIVPENSRLYTLGWLLVTVTQPFSVAANIEKIIVTQFAYSKDFLYWTYIQPKISKS